MNKYNFLLIFTFVAGTVSGQSLLVKRAEEAMQRWDYVTAIDFFEQVLRREDAPETRLQLAECYRRTNQTRKAAAQYAAAVNSAAARPIHYLYYAQMLQALGSCTDAQPWFDRYAAAAPYDIRGQNLRSSCVQQSELEQRGRAVFSVSPIIGNSPQNDYSPVLYNGRIFFASERVAAGPAQRTNLWNGGSFARLYTAPVLPAASNQLPALAGEPERYLTDSPVRLHEAAAAFAPDGKTLYLTCSNFEEDATALRTEEGLVKLGIYTGPANPEAGADAKAWRRLPLVSPNYSMAHPSLSADGKLLFFASNMPGGFGGMDLYVSQWEDGRWGLPFNLGAAVNTEGNELFPFAEPGGRLYFASDGHAGLGGLDVFYTLPLGRGDWAQPVNLGAPINSASDDFSFVLAPGGSWGFMASNRLGGQGGDDIYAFTRLAVAVELSITDARTRKPLKDVQLQTGRFGRSLTTGPDGRLVFDLALDSCLTLQAFKEGYMPARLPVCARQAGAGGQLQMTLNLKKEEQYLLQGLVFDMMDGLPAQGAKVWITADCGLAADTTFTGADGRYRFRLRPNCCYTVRAAMPGYITARSDGYCSTDPSGAATLSAYLNLQPYRDAEGFVVDDASKAVESIPQDRFHYNDLSGLYEDDSGNPVDADLSGGLIIRGGIMFDNGSPVTPGRNVWKPSQLGLGYLVNLYYDLDKVEVRSVSYPELEKLRQMLRENPDIKVEIASHTDSRGSNAYNQELSQRRADWVVNWLADNGIARDRLRASGYGETQPVNDCRDGTPCREEEHALNRRTEFRIQQ